jgi:PAS domain S-box-containing protein
MDNLLNILWNFSTDGFVLAHADGTILKANPSFCNIVVDGAQQLVGKKLFSFLNECDRNSVTAHLERVIYLQDIRPNLTLTIKCADGSEKKVAFNATPAGSENEQKVVLVIFKDITKQEEFEIEMIKAREHVEETDRLKTAFLANISHEIRTPMNGIIGFSGMLLDPGMSGDRLKHFVELIITSCNHLLDLINDIIDLSRIEAGQIEVQNKEFFLNDLLNDLYHFFLYTAQSKGIKLLLNPGLEMQQSKVLSDDMKLRQVLVNIISNALKFTSEGTVEFGYHIKNKEIEFYVSDTGIGIDKVHFKTIFERFSQADNSSTRQYGGTGLGLPISKSFVEILGGRIWLESAIGKGSTFYFSTPFHSITSKARFAEIEVLGLDWHDKTVLIAEDEEINFIYIYEALSETKINVIRAVNGLEVIEKVKQMPTIDLILMDVKMPEMNGYEATALVKQMNPTIPIIAQTAYALASDRENALAAGCDDYISKPVKKEKLLSTIYKYLV